MLITYLVVGGVTLFVFVVIVATLVVSRVRSERRRRALELLRKRDQSRRALVRYVQLNRQCSEEAAYQRLATFVKKHVPHDDHSYVGGLLASDRPSLLEHAQRLLAHDPDGLDKI